MSEPNASADKRCARQRTGTDDKWPALILQLATVAVVSAVDE